MPWVGGCAVLPKEAVESCTLIIEHLGIFVQSDLAKGLWGCRSIGVGGVTLDAHVT